MTAHPTPTQILENASRDWTCQSFLTLANKWASGKVRLLDGPDGHAAISASPSVPVIASRASVKSVFGSGDAPPTYSERFFPLGRIALFCFLTAVTARGADDLAAKKAELCQWIMSYYQKPDPERFVERVRDMSRAGMLYDPSPEAAPDHGLMFLGKVMAGNSNRITQWLDALSSLPPDDLRALKRAAWYSGATQAKDWLEKHGEAELANSPPPVLLAKQRAMHLEPYHLDQLWEWFFATGDREPIDRIVSLFSLAHEPPRTDSYELLTPPTKPTSVSPPKDTSSATAPRQGLKLDDEARYRLRMSNYRILQPALWSTTSLAIQQDRVLEILKQIEKTHYHAGIKAWVGQIIRIAEHERAKENKK
jgi:hypothetical protein